MSRSDFEAGGHRLRCIMAIVIGMAVFSSLADSASRTASEVASLPLWAVVLNIVLGAVSFGAVMGGIAVIQCFPWEDMEGIARLWISRLAAGTVGGAAGMVTLAALADAGDPARAVIPAVGVGIAACAGIEWLMLRGRDARSGAIALVGLAGLFVAALATALGDYVSGGFAGSELGGAVFGAMYAAVTCVPLRGGGGHNQRHEGQ